MLFKRSNFMAVDDQEKGNGGIFVLRLNGCKKFYKSWIDKSGIENGDNQQQYI